MTATADLSLAALLAVSLSFAMLGAASASAASTENKLEPRPGDKAPRRPEPNPPAGKDTTKAAQH